MARRVFFSFHCEDVRSFRANVVRNHDRFKESGEAGFFDWSIWEDAKLHGDNSVKRLVDESLERTSVTCVLIGTETWKRRWVRYEILKSYERGNKLIGIHINDVRDKERNVRPAGSNPFEYLGFTISPSGKTLTFHEHDGKKWEIYQDLPRLNGQNFPAKHCDKGFVLSDWVPVYNWTKDDGYNHFSSWIEIL